MEVEHFILHENGWVPNNDRLPVLLYRSAMSENPDAAASDFERLFAQHGRPPRWRNGVYDYHHYHSTAHEALGIAGGFAPVDARRPGGREIKVSAGDALVLPTGTGHRRIEASRDFLVVRAYPAGQEWDICHDAPSEDA
jgi:uncharacterized protein YjlB